MWHLLAARCDVEADGVIGGGLDLLKEGAVTSRHRDRCCTNGTASLDVLKSFKVVALKYWTLHCIETLHPSLKDDEVCLLV